MGAVCYLKLEEEALISGWLCHSRIHLSNAGRSHLLFRYLERWTLNVESPKLIQPSSHPPASTVHISSYPHHHVFTGRISIIHTPLLRSLPWFLLRIRPLALMPRNGYLVGYG